MRREPGKLVTLWNALADPTRRGILDLLRRRPHTTGELAQHFPSTRFAVMKHLNALENAGLVLVRRQGRERWNHLNAVPLQLLYERWVRPYEALWAARLTGVKSRLEGASMQPATVASTIRQVELEIEIAAAPERVWKGLVEETAFWWPKSFYTSAKTRAFRIEPRLGGMMYEDWGNGEGIIWYRIFGIETAVALHLEGCMTPPYGPAHGILKLELVKKGRGTVLKLSDSTIGAPTGCGSSKEDGWRELFEGALKRHVEAHTEPRP
jgi:DNA-binding transcriptional ArsR family regulator